jgi:hypothetical protein
LGKEKRGNLVWKPCSPSSQPTSVQPAHHITTLFLILMTYACHGIEGYPVRKVHFLGRMMLKAHKSGSGGALQQQWQPSKIRPLGRKKACITMAFGGDPYEPLERAIRVRVITQHAAHATHACIAPLQPLGPIFPPLCLQHTSYDTSYGFYGCSSSIEWSPWASMPVGTAAAASTAGAMKIKHPHKRSAGCSLQLSHPPVLQWMTPATPHVAAPVVVVQGARRGAPAPTAEPAAVGPATRQLPRAVP